MTPPSVVLRERARQDVDEAVAHYLDRAGSEVAIEFTDRLEQAFGHIADSPASGSPRYGHEVNLPGLRSWRLGSYPYLVFYMAAAGHIDVSLFQPGDEPERGEL